MKVTRRRAWLQIAPAALLAIALTGCGAARDAGVARGVDGPPDAVPRHEPLSATGNDPYIVNGVRYRPLSSSAGFVQHGIASWYGGDFHGRRTSSGERYDMHAMSAAHQLLPLPSYVRVTNLESGRSVVVRVNDRGPFVHGRVIDLSHAAARKLGIWHPGTARVEVRALAPGDPVPADNAVVASGEDAATLPVASAGGGILVQIGAYARRDNAHALRERVRHAGYRVAKITPAEQDETGLYRVRVGPYADTAEAQTAKQQLEAMLGWRAKLVEE